MLVWLAVVALAEPVELHVGVHAGAGVIEQVAADGAAGMCTVLDESHLTCPAAGPVTFRWGPGGEWELSGDATLEPGQNGVAFVLATETAREDALASLQPDVVTPEVVWSLFVRNGANEPPVPSRGMLDALVALLDHPDARVRRAAADGLQEWLSGTPNDPWPMGAPSPVPQGTLLRIATDRDKGVRRRTLDIVRDLRPPFRTDEATEALVRLSRDPAPGIRRGSIAVLARASDHELLPPEEAWDKAMKRIPWPGAQGRASCNTLAKLHSRLEPGTVDARAGLALVLEHHPERGWRVWTAWRKEVPFERGLADVLLRRTLGVGETLLKHWAEHHPEELAAALEAWEPGPTHSERFQIAQSYLVNAEHPAVREALGLPPSEPEESNNSSDP